MHVLICSLLNFLHICTLPRHFNTRQCKRAKYLFITTMWIQHGGNQQSSSVKGLVMVANVVPNFSNKN